MFLNIGMYTELSKGEALERWLLRNRLKEGRILRLEGIWGDPERPESASLSLQLKFESRSELEAWASSELPRFLSSLRDEFGDTVVAFPTILSLVGSPAP